MSGSVTVHLLMNDEHGHETGRCGAVTFNDDDAHWEADPLDWETRGPVCRIEGAVLRFSRRLFPITASKEWVGIWCWNAVTMAHDDALRLCRTLVACRFTCVGGFVGSPFDLSTAPLIPPAAPRGDGGRR